MESKHNPMNPSQVLRLRQAPRCGAWTRRGTACQSPAMSGKTRCRIHGGKAGAPSGERNGRYQTGLHTKEMRKLRKEIAHMNRLWRDLRGRL